MKELPRYMRRNLGLVIGLVLVIALCGLAIFGPRGSEARHNSTGARTISTSTAQNNAATIQQPKNPDKNALTTARNWTGGDNNDSNWTSNGNWSGVGGAVADDDLIFPVGAARKANSNNFAVNTRFHSITISDTDYSISGSQIFLSTGISGNATSNTGVSPVFTPNIILDANQTFSNTGRPLFLNGVVNLNTHSLTVSGDGSIVFNGFINGTGSLTISNSGNASATINGNSSGFGTTQINSGSLNVASSGTLGIVSLSGGTLIGTGTTGSIVSFVSGGTIAPGQGLTTTGILTSTGTVTLNGATILEINLNGTAVGSQYDRLATNNNTSLNNANLQLALGFTPAVGQQFTIISLSSGTVIGQFAQGTSIVAGGQIFTITYNTNGVVLTAQGSSLTWDGGGADNNWSTAANWNPNVAPVDGLDLVFPTGAARLSNTNDISGLDLRSLAINGNDYNISGNAINLSNGLTANPPAGGSASHLGLSTTLTTQAQTFSSNGGKALAIDGSLNLNGFGWTVDGPSGITMVGSVSGSGGLTKNGTGTLLLLANNSFAGATIVNNGILRVGNTNALGATGTVNNTVVANSGTLELLNVINVPEAISLSGAGFGGIGALHSANCATGCSLSGTITLTGNSTVSVDTSDTVTLNGAIGGAFGLTKAGPGTLILGATNTYNGTTTINAGTLLVNGTNLSSSVNLTAGTLGGNGIVDGINATGGTVAPGNGGPGTLSSVGNVTFNTATTFNVEIGGTTAGTFDRMFGFAGAAVNLGGANLTGTLINGFNPATGTQFPFMVDTTNSTTSGQFAQGNSVTIGGRQFSITYTTLSVVLTAGPGTFTWDGGGADSNWTTAANWVGDTAPSAGDSLVFPDTAARKTNANDFAAGTNFGSLTITGADHFIAGNALNLSNGLTVNTPAAGNGSVLNLNLTLTQAQGFLNNGLLPCLLGGQLNLNGFALTVDGTNNINLAGNVIGAGGITKNGTGVLFFQGIANTYSGVTQINNGTIDVRGTNSLGATGAGNNTVVAAGATLRVAANTTNVPEAITLNGNGSGGAGAFQTLACPSPSGCSISGAVTLASSAALGGSNGDTLTINGAIGETGGPRGLTKVGAGTLILGGPNNYSGGTTVSSGTLLVNGSTGNVQLNGGTLGGTGTVGSITGNGTVAPGASPGILNANGNVTFGAATTLSVEINGSTVGSQYDQLNVTGSGAVNLGGANLVGSLGGGFNPADGTQFTILQTTGTITGQFVQGSSVSFSGKNFHITYNSNSVVLTAFTPLVNNAQFSAASYNAGEGAFSATITVTRTGDTSGTSTIDYATSDLGAEQRTDYTIGAGTITFAPGEISKTFDVLLVDDLFVESNETLNLTLSNPTGGAVLGSQSAAVLTITENDSTSPTTNPLDNADERFFVRQHFYDFLSRLPDQGGFDFWVGQITQCGLNQTCVNSKRLDVSNAFFFEQEYQQTGAYVFRLYRAAFGNTQPSPNPLADPNHPNEEKKLLSYAAFSLDRAHVVGGADLASGQLGLANVFVQRAAFLAKYPGNLDGPSFVDAVVATIKNDLGADLTSQRTALINLFNSGGRGAVMYRLADDNATNPISNEAFIDAEYNRAFVATQYFGYLRRDPDIDGFLFWLGQVSSAPLRDVPKQHSMVCAFNTSLEYQFRFSPVATRNDGECPH